MTEDLWMPEGLESQHKKSEIAWQKSLLKLKIGKIVTFENCLGIGKIS